MTPLKKALVKLKKIVDKEIDWCKNNKDIVSDKPKGYADGFIDGLKQAKFIVDNLEKRVK